MPKLDYQQKTFIEDQLTGIQNRIKQYSSLIQGQDVPKLKKQFIGAQIKQLQVVKQQMQNMLKQED